jgi:gas vesicle structural protein
MNRASPCMLVPPSRRAAGFERPVSLSEVLDRVLNKGVVVAGEIVISVAGVDLVYLGLNVLLTSVETALQSSRARGADDAC